MEEKGGNKMVGNLKWSIVTSVEVQNANYRLEATAFNVEAKKAKQYLDDCKYPLTTLTGINGLADSYRPGIVKRIFVERGNGIPMFTPSEITNINPKAEKFLSKYTDTDLSIWQLKKGEIALTCSGTIGNISYVSRTLDGKCFSQNMIRIVPHEFGGYIYSYLKSEIGQTILNTNNYGAVIQHIDPEHLQTIKVPNPPDEIKKSVHEKILQSFEARDRSNELLTKAETLLIDNLALPAIEEIQIERFRAVDNLQNFEVPIDQLASRLDASFHLPLANRIIDYLLDNADSILKLNDRKLTKAILHPERFKRVYVTNDEGIPFFGGKNLLSIDPGGKKYISANKHAQRLPGLVLRENYLLVTRSGTIGKINIVPEHWDGWIATDDLLRVIPNNLPGYLYIWLNSDYGKELICRHTYGSVVDHIEIDHLANVPVPILNDAIMEEINKLALSANKLRSEAYRLEQSAIKQVNDDVIGIPQV